MRPKLDPADAGNLYKRAVTPRPRHEDPGADPHASGYRDRQPVGVAMDVMGLELRDSAAQFTLNSPTPRGPSLSVALLANDFLLPHWRTMVN